jgi:hypothetical protein
LTPGQLASLDTACDALAAPYRGEGFGLPILEGVACGLAPIVPRGGPSDDFVTDDTGYRLQAEEVETEHDWRLCGPPLELQVSVDELRTALRAAYSNREKTKAMGEAASRSIHEHFTWEKTISLMRKRIADLAAGVPLPSLVTKAKVHRPVVAACVRVNGDASQLPDCLAGLAPFIGQIVVVSNKQCDRTESIAKEYGARFFAGKRKENSGALPAEADWICWIAATDRLAESDLRRLDEVATERWVYPESHIMVTRDGVQITIRPPWIRTKDDGSCELPYLRREDLTT